MSRNHEMKGCMINLLNRLDWREGFAQISAACHRFSLNMDRCYRSGRWLSRKTLVSISYTIHTLLLSGLYCWNRSLYRRPSHVNGIKNGTPLKVARLLRCGPCFQKNWKNILKSKQNDNQPCSLSEKRLNPQWGLSPFQTLIRNQFQNDPSLYLPYHAQNCPNRLPPTIQAELE